MGLYDEFICPGVACPRCGAEVPEDWQSKALDCALRVYRQGDEVLTECGPLITDGLVPVHTICESCATFIAAWAEIRGGRFVGVVKAQVPAWYEAAVQGDGGE